jgi:hypothetical protein
MFAANTYRIRVATADDADALMLLVQQGYQPPLVGREPIGEIDRTPAQCENDRVAA